MLTREALHRLVDDIPEESLGRACASLAEFAADPVLAAILSAAEDDEPLMDEERAAIERRLASRGASHLVPHEEVERALPR